MVVELITVQRAQQAAPLAAIDPEKVRALIQAASQWAENWCERSFAKQTHTETIDGNGEEFLFLRNFPMTGLTSVTVLDHGSGTSTVLQSTAFVYDSLTGELRFKGAGEELSYFPEGFQNIVVVYEAGFTTVPEAVQQAVVELCLDLHAGSAADPRLAATSLGGQYSEASIFQFVQDRSLPEGARRLLARYRSINP